MLLAARLASTAIERIAYDEEERELSIWFRETGRYVYSDVPDTVYRELRYSDSPGAYFNRCIKRRFPCRPEPERCKFRPAFSG